MDKSIQPWLNFKSFEKKLSLDLEAALKKCNHPITLNEFYVLYYLNKTNGNKLTISEISDKIGLSLSATSRMLARFEKTCGVIVRNTCVEDKRAIQITLTELGRERLENNYSALKPVLNSYKEKLSLF